MRITSLIATPIEVALKLNASKTMMKHVQILTIKNRVEIVGYMIQGIFQLCPQYDMVVNVRYVICMYPIIFLKKKNNEFFFS